MKPIKTKRVGEPSSKYGYEPNKLDDDLRDKLEVACQFRKDLKKVLYGNYKYKDGKPMSYLSKQQILMRVYLEFRESRGIDESQS